MDDKTKYELLNGCWWDHKSAAEYFTKVLGSDHPKTKIYLDEANKISQEMKVLRQKIDEAN